VILDRRAEFLCLLASGQVVGVQATDAGAEFAQTGADGVASPTIVDPEIETAS
jgi:hypothetical protein